MLVAHRRAGKTVACVNDLIKRAITENKPNARYAYLAPFYSQAKGLAWDYLKYYAAPLLKELPRESDLSVELINGARIRLYGADNPNTLRGLYFDGVIIDEYADMKPTTWAEVLRPALSDRKGWAVFIGTPKGKNDFWEIWDRAGKDPTWYRKMVKASQTVTLPDPPLSAEELADARKSMTQDQYDQEYECSFEAAITGAVYGKWMREAADAGRIGVVPVAPHVPVNTSWDLGLSDNTAIWWWQVLPGEIRLVDYYENNGEQITHYCDVVKNKPYKYGRHWVPHDAAHKLLAAGGRSIVNQMHEAGVPASVIPSTSQMNSINATRMTLERCWFDETNCAKGIECLRQYQFEFDDDKKTFKDNPRHDWTSHGADAFEIIAQVWKAPDSERPKPEPKFLHNTPSRDIFWPTSKSPIRTERV